MSKRYLRRLVEEGFVSGWDDPRMPTLCGMRRRGYTPAAIRDFLDRIGVAKADSVVDAAMLEHCVREDLNETAIRRMAVLDPVLVEIENWDEGKFETIELENHPNHPELGIPHRPLRQARLYRTGRFCGGAAEQVLPPQAGRRGAAQGRVYHQVHPLGKGRCGQHHEDRLHL